MSEPIPASHPASQPWEAFLMAAKQAEIKNLQALETTANLVTQIAELIHSLQKERALSNLYLLAADQGFTELRQQQIAISQEQAQQLTERLTRHYLAKTPLPNQSLRLFNGIAMVLQGIGDLDLLRKQITQRLLPATEASLAFRRLVAALLALVFDAADIASEPMITKTLVALFHFMQGKEYAGQERALGAIGFANGEFDSLVQDNIQQLHEQQHSSFSDFSVFCGQAIQKQWQACQQQHCFDEFEQLRQLIQRLDNQQRVATQISEAWYRIATQRIDLLETLEQALIAQLRQQCQQQLRRAKQELQEQLINLNTASQSSGNGSLLFDRDALPFTDRYAQRTLTPANNAGSVYALMQAQSEKIKEMQAALSEARRSLDERKYVERAKGLLMQQYTISEEQAYSRMRQQAMASNMRLADLAQRLLHKAGAATP